MIKKLNLIFIILFALLFSNLVGAVPENSLGEDLIFLVGTSDAGVYYDRELIGQFLASEWVYVMVDIKDITNITIPNRNSPDFESMLQERNEILIKQTNAVLNTLSDEEFQLKTNSEFGGFFSGNITKDGFEKLLHDERVGHIYSKKYGHINSGSTIFGLGIYFLPIILLITVIILLIKLKKRKYVKKS